MQEFTRFFMGSAVHISLSKDCKCIDIDCPIKIQDHVSRMLSSCVVQHRSNDIEENNLRASLGRCLIHAKCNDVESCFNILSLFQFRGSCVDIKGKILLDRPGFYVSNTVLELLVGRQNIDLNDYVLVMELQPNNTSDSVVPQKCV